MRSASEWEGVLPKVKLQYAEGSLMLGHFGCKASSPSSSTSGLVCQSRFSKSQSVLSSKVNQVRTKAFIISLDLCPKVEDLQSRGIGSYLFTWGPLNLLTQSLITWSTRGTFSTSIYVLECNQKVRTVSWHSWTIDTTQLNWRTLKEFLSGSTLYQLLVLLMEQKEEKTAR